MSLLSAAGSQLLADSSHSVTRSVQSQGQSRRSVLDEFFLGVLRLLRPTDSAQRLRHAINSRVPLLLDLRELSLHRIYLFPESFELLLCGISLKKPHVPSFLGGNTPPWRTPGAMPTHRPSTPPPSN